MCCNPVNLFVSMVVLFGALFGLLIGSFLSVVVTRYETGETVVRGRSRCRTCGQDIRWYDNIPLVSYLLLRGRCRACAQSIAPLYPAIELVTAVTYAGIAYSVYDAPGSTMHQVGAFVFLASVAAGLIVIFFYDITTMHIPMRIVWSVLGVLGVAAAVRVGVWHDMSMSALEMHAIGGAVGFTFLFLLSALSGETWMGAGDAYIGLIGGLITAWPAVVFFLTVSFGLGAIVGIALIALKVRTRKDAVPFAPFLICGIVVTVLFPLLFPDTALLVPYV